MYQFHFIKKGGNNDQWNTNLVLHTKKDVIAITIYNIQLRVVALRKNYDEMITWKS